MDISKQLTKEITKGQRADQGKIYRLIRELLHCSQTDFATRIGVQGVTISRWENNKIDKPMLTYSQYQNLRSELKKINICPLQLPEIIVALSAKELTELEETI